MIRATLITGFVFTLGFPLHLSASQAQENQVVATNLQRLPILQGPTDGTTTQIVVLRSASDSLVYSVGGSPQLKMSLTTESRPPSRWVLDHLLIQRSDFQTAQPANGYQLQVRRAGGASNLLDQRIFGFLESDGENSVRVAVVSCASDRLTAVGNETPWRHLESKHADALIWLGDNVYASYFRPITADQHWQRFVETRRALGVFYWPRLVPSFAVWDDHDYGNGNNGSGDYSEKEEVTQNFFAFFGQRLNPGPGVSHSVDFSTFRVILFDGRSFRSPGSVLGSQQLAWGLDEINEAQSEKRFLVLGHGYKFFAAREGGESIELDAPQELASLLESSRESILEDRFLALSGDVHYSEYSIHSAEGFSVGVSEATSSSVHSVRAPGARLPENPHRQAAFFGDSFMVFTFDPIHQSVLGEAFSSSSGRMVFSFSSK